MCKKKIGLVTTWYPSEENPYNGVFFKEQAFVLEDDFDFTVIHYREKRVSALKYLIRRMKGELFHVEKIHEERNTVEYDADLYVPKYMIYQNKFYDLYQKYVKHRSNVGIGTYISGKYQKMKEENIRKIFQQQFQGLVDVFYCVDAQKESYTLQCAAKALGKPYVVSEHAPFPWPGETLKDTEKAAIEDADLFFAISYDKIRQVLLQNVKLKKVAYVGNLVDEERFLPAKGSDGVKTFIMVAAHSFYKNYDLFIEIFNRLTEITEIPFKVMIVGYGANKGYSKNEHVLEEKIRNSKFAAYAEMIPEVGRDQIAEVYGRADAFVMTSIQEGMPVSALEAACCGLPVFSTICGGVEDYVTEKIGRLYKVIDRESFAFGLKDYLEGKTEFDREYIRRFVVEHYGKRAFASRMADAFYSVLGKDSDHV